MVEWKLEHKIPLYLSFKINLYAHVIIYTHFFIHSIIQSTKQNKKIHINNFRENIIIKLKWINQFDLPIAFNQYVLLIMNSNEYFCIKYFGFHYELWINILKAFELDATKMSVCLCFFSCIPKWWFNYYLCSWMCF